MGSVLLKSCSKRTGSEAAWIGVYPFFVTSTIGPAAPTARHCARVNPIPCSFTRGVQSPSSGHTLACTSHHPSCFAYAGTWISRKQRSRSSRSPIWTGTTLNSTSGSALLLERLAGRIDTQAHMLRWGFRQTETGVGPLAQLGERLLCKQEVSGSIPLGSNGVPSGHRFRSFKNHSYSLETPASIKTP